MLKLFGCLLDLIFPKHCLSCQRIGQWLCTDCSRERLNLKLMEIPISFSEEVDRIFHIANFDDQLAAKIVKTCKYQGVQELGRFMGQRIAQEISNSHRLSQATFLPVPLHPLKLRTRGFNQAQLIASELGGRSLEGIIKRKRNIKAQAQLSRVERLINLEDAFGLVDGNLGINADLVVIVDDVVTTGTTMNEIAKLLKKAGVKEVWGLAFAHGQ